MADTTAPFRDVMPVPPGGGSEGDTVNDRSRQASAPSLRASERTRAGRVSERWAASASGPAPAAQGPRLIGGGELELVGELARGGMGAVYRALDRRLGREVAVKVMLGGGADPEERERFEVEARASARLKHPNIVGIHRVGEERGLPYLVMDLVPGESLHKRLGRDGPLAPRDAARVGAKLARALAFAHARGVLHRDMKPHNVLLTPDGEPVLTDFGLAKEVEQSRELTVTGQVLGTPAFMAPEQARGDNERVDRRADVYGLGATLYAALTGRPPFQAGSAIALLAKVSEDPVEPPRRTHPGIDRDLETIVLRCLEKEPAARYDRAQDLAEDLERYLAGEPIRARRQGALERAGRWVRRHRLASAGLVGALLLAAAVGGLTRVVAQDRLLDEARAAAVEARERARAPAEGGRLGASLRWLQAAQRWADLARTREARDEQLAAAFGLGEVAVAEAQWQLAAEAFRLSGLEPGDGDLQAALRSVEERRLGALRRTFEETMATIERGELTDPREAAFALVRHAEPEMVQLLAGRVREAVEVVRRVRREMLDEVARPTPLEAGAGWSSLEEELLRAFALLDRDQPPPEGDATDQALEVVTRAAFRVGNRRVTSERVGRANFAELGWLEVARAQARALGDVGARQALACLEALGRIGGADRVTAEQALMAYLRADVSEASTIAAVRASSRLGVSLGQAQRLVETRIGPLRLPEVLLASSSGLAPSSGVSSPGELAEQVKRYFDRGDLARAREALRGGLERWPDDSELLAVQTIFSLTVGELEAALTTADRVLALDPGPQSLAWRARALAAAGEFERARRDLEEASRLATASRDSSSNHWEAIGQAWLVLGERVQAEAALRRALDGNPSNLGATACLVQLLMALDRHAEAEPLLDRALEADPQSVQLQLSRAELLLARRGDTPGALDVLERVRQQAPDMPMAIEVRAQLLLSAGRYGDASSAANELLRLDAGNPVGRWVLAQVAIAERRPGEADDHCRRGLARAKARLERLPLLTAHANALLLLNRVDEAMAAAEEALALMPDDGDALLMRAGARVRRGEYDLALADLDRAVSLAPRNVDLLFARGGLYQQRGDIASARRDYEAVLAADPGEARAYVQLAFLALAQGDLGLAQDELTRAIEAAPGSGEYQLLRAEVRLKDRDLEAAAADLDAALQKEPDLARAWARRAALRLALGAEDAARADARRAVELRPTDVPTLEALVPTLVRLGRVDVALDLVEDAAPRTREDGAWLDRARADLRARGR